MENASKNNYAKTCVLNVTADVKDGKNYVSDVYFTSPFKVMKPFHLNKNYMTVMMQTASAGILKGDTQELNFDIRDNASMELVSQSYEKLHKMDGGNARRDCTIKVGKNALFKYSPLPTIPFYDSGFDSTIHAELADDTSKLILMEILTSGRVAYGETFEYRYYNSLITVRKAGKLIYNDNTMFDPSEGEMNNIGVYEGYTHMANLLFFNMQDKASNLDLIREIIDNTPNVTGGASIIQSGDTSVKLLGKTAQELYDLCEKIAKAILD